MGGGRRVPSPRRAPVHVRAHIRRPGRRRLYGTAVDPDCHATLAQLRIGSNVKKIPQSILDDYRRSFRAKRGDAIDWPSVVLTNGTTDKETGQ